MKKIFILLAKSVKNKHLCIAGKEITEQGYLGNWIRPVIFPNEEIPKDIFNFNIGGIYSCNISRKGDTLYQPENHILDDNHNWEVVDKYRCPEFNKLIDYPETLWGSECRLTPDDAIRYNSSLYFIFLSRAFIKAISKFKNGIEYKQLRVLFKYNDIEYDIPSTSIDLNNAFYNNIEVGSIIEINNVYIALSLGKEYGGYCYRLVSGYVKI